MENLVFAISQAVTITTKTTLPAPVTLTGTISSSGVRVTGVGTKFLTEIAAAGQISLKVQYLWDSTNCELRGIATVVSDTVLTLQVAFTNSLSGQALQVPNPGAIYREVSLAPNGTGCLMCTANKPAVTMNGSVMMNFENEGGLPPLALDGTANSIQVTYQ